ncbi:twin-arginine translocation pathway signal sequence domain protein [Candidatus Rhodobacter oscarellae]|uniref:Twin-arginine translocation pathway signal sequence domain protein n=1 Tax=Candidatus Rhodobacter oscarellae TaxID=1675527 RepID=A0A0J9E624_9RHOB|nr:lipid-binding SYLF domain-containing protein [Candidatus Rhodobacter lobularis]KMW57274.1 twin-arginine translocation pathway signal sequence domain protein [Candidatus Rhodobacter lobularis]
MDKLPRRTFMVGAGAATLMTAACGNGVNSRGAQTIEARVESTLNFLFNKYPNTVELDNKAVGKLVMPLVTKAGFGVGASYGRGALRVGGVTVDYYSQASGSFGLQIGAQQFSHVLFFMTQDALSDFRSSPGWSAGADAEFVLNENGENLSADTVTALSPVIALIFGQAGLQAGATLKGTKYTRIIP